MSELKDTYDRAYADYCAALDEQSAAERKVRDSLTPLLASIDALKAAGEWE